VARPWAMQGKPRCSRAPQAGPKVVVVITMKEVGRMMLNGIIGVI